MADVVGYDPVEDAIRGFSAHVESILGLRPHFSKSSEIIEVPTTLPYLAIVNVEVRENTLLRKTGPAVYNRYESAPGASGVDRVEIFDMPIRADIIVEMIYYSDSNREVMQFNSKILLAQQTLFFTTPFEKDLLIETQVLRGRRSVPNLSDVRSLSFAMDIMSVEVLGNLNDRALIQSVEQEFEAVSELTRYIRPLTISLIAGTTDPTIT